jgi:hypothetical protein
MADDNVYRLPSKATPPNELTIDMEARFLAVGQTLSDDATVTTYRTTLDAVALMLDGSRALEMLGQEGYDHVRRILADMHAAPDGL